MFRKFISRFDKGRPFRGNEFWLIDWNKRYYVRGNFSAFGLRGGLSANISLMCPLYNTLRYYGIRHLQLAFDTDPLIASAIERSLGNENQD